MKSIGMIGGMSWESTVTYYQTINEIIKERLGGLHSAKILLYSVDFAEVEKFQRVDDWDECAMIMADIAVRLERGGADYLVMCTNTMHKVVPQIEKLVRIPFIHIADATIEQLHQAQITKVGLLGTKYTMTGAFYKDRITDQGIEVVIPSDEQMDLLNGFIFEELCLGQIKDATKQAILAIIADLIEQGIQGLILGCTEIGMIIKPEDVAIQLFDTTLIHATKAALLALEV